MLRRIEKSIAKAGTNDNIGTIKLSVIIPVYNVGKYLETCIKSVMEQTYQCWEMILVDDVQRIHQERFVSYKDEPMTGLKCCNK